MPQGNGTILLTIDVEDWFQVENFKPWIPYESWGSCELRVEENVHRLLDLFDAHASTGSVQPSMNEDQQTAGLDPHATNNKQQQKIHCTFFVLAWVAERLPHLIREIQARGHEIASHGYRHELCADLLCRDLGNDLSKSKKVLEDIIGMPVSGYRAPSFSVSNEVIGVVEECGYRYDSSYNSFAMHGRYGQISLNGNLRKGIAYQLSRDFFELPISNLECKSRNSQFTIHNSKPRLVLPWGGGGYFRLLPFPLFAWGVKRILKKDSAYLFYMHPWEIDAKQPRVNQACRSYRFRHYTNLETTFAKLRKLLETFRFQSFQSCTEYLETSGSNHVP